MIKKSVYFLVLVCMVLATSCSQNEMQENKFNREMQDGIKVSTEGFFPDSAVQKFILENPEYYVFGNSHSDLWLEESSFRSLTAQPSLNAYGYDVKVQIGTGCFRVDHATAEYI